MNPEAFRREYQGFPQLETEAAARLRELAREYHQRTEDYDRTVCTGPIRNGSIYPIGPHERLLINRNAKRLHSELGAQALELGFNYRQWQDAVLNAAQNQ